MLKSTCPKHDVHTLQAEKGSADISWGYSDPYGESVLPFLLFRIGLTISVPVLSISHAKLCIRQREALLTQMGAICIKRKWGIMVLFFPTDT